MRMNIKKYMLLASVGMMAAACQDKNDYEPKPSGSEGDDVHFGATVSRNADPRTIFGPEDTDNKSFPIYWLKEDQMMVASPQCAAGRNTGTYGVNPDAFEEGETTSTYAGTLIRKGDAGVQWGKDASADFYSIYPQRPKPNDVTTSDGSSFNITTPETQNCILETKDSNPWMKTADMNACFMYAKTAGVSRGETVDLRYVPFSTAIRFTLTGPEGDGEAVITNITLNAPDGCPISGSYTVDLSSVDSNAKYPDVKAIDASTSAKMSAHYANNAKLQLANSKSVELNIFVMLESNPTVAYDISKGWSISVVMNNKTQTLSLDGKVAGTGKLKPGEVYRLPTLPPLNASEWDVKNWMVNIPRNVYLSEISIPGSWNSLNSDFQSTGEDYQAKINGQYNVGCRAFHLDTRWKGNKERTYTDFAHFCIESDVEQLSVATGGKGNTLDVYNRVGGITGYLPLGKQEGVVMKPTNPDFADALNTVVANVIGKDEYIVIMCTFAQNSYHRTDKTWMQAVSEACNSIPNRDYIYDASKITPYTTVGDVIGKAIVIVNCDSKITSASALPANSKCLFTYMPMVRDVSQYKDKYDTDKIWTSSSESGITFNNTLAQVTYQSNSGTVHETGIDTNARGYAPAFKERTNIANNICTWSAGNYKDPNYQHNNWIFLGLGGYTVVSEDSSTGVYAYTNVASKMNGWIDGILNGMSVSTGYYPVGIALVNRAEDKISSQIEPSFDSPSTIKNILMLNNKFHKAFDPTKPAFPNKTSGNSASPRISGDGWH